MNRRNFVVGLGTVATVSGVASVTAASFANSVTASADFRVVVDEELIFRRGTDFENESEFDGGLETATDDADFENAVSGSDPVAVWVNDQTNTNGAVETNLALLNDPGNADITTLNGIYEIENAGAATQDVNITFDFGESVTAGDVTEQNVLDLFVFEHNGDQISPGTFDSGEQQNPPESLTIAGTETEQIDLALNVDAVAGDLADVANVNPFADGGTQETLDLVDAINVGTDYDVGGGDN